jgi:hypothetical protein
MADRVRELPPRRGLEVSQQVELAAVVGPVVWAIRGRSTPRLRTRPASAGSGVPDRSADLSRIRFSSDRSPPRAEPRLRIPRCDLEEFLEQGQAGAEQRAERSQAKRSGTAS